MEFVHGKQEIKLFDGEEEIGEITFKEQGENKWKVTHTYVDPEWRGRGYAEKLVEALVEKAEKENQEIIKNKGCPYVVKLFDKKKEKYDRITVLG